MDNIDFSQGINRNTEPINTPKGSYRDALNMRKSGSSLKTDESYHKFFGDHNYLVWGDCNIGKEIIVLYSEMGAGFIASIDVETDTLTPIFVDVDDVFGIRDYLQVEGRPDWSGDRVIYFTNDYGMFRFNLDMAGEYASMTAEELAKSTSMFPDHLIPKVSYSDTLPTGELLSGTYEFFARLVTDNGVSTAFSLSSNVVPVIEDSLSGNIGEVNGCPPQTPTNKAIELEITNIDTAYKYIELAVVTYVGLDNAIKINLGAKRLINNRSSIKIVYRGEPDNTSSLTAHELLYIPVQYSGGKFLTQKDNTLLIGGPIEKEEPDIDWFRVASNIVVRDTYEYVPVTEMLAFSLTREPPYGGGGPTFVYNIIDETIETLGSPVNQDYVQPGVVNSKKSFRRGEVYAFTLTPRYTNGLVGATVHIPATAVSGGVTRWDSTEEYPDDRYPGISAGDKVRLHKMPTNSVLAPDAYPNERIKLLGVEFQNIRLDASELSYADQVDSIVFGMVDRTGNETIFAQGIVRPNTMVETADDSPSVKSIFPGDGRTSWQYDCSDGGASSQSHPTSYLWDDFTFVSPDIIHGLHTATEASHISQVGTYRAFDTLAGADVAGQELGVESDSLGRPKVFFNNVTHPSGTVDSTKVPLQGFKRVVPPMGVTGAGIDGGGRKNYTVASSGDELELASTDGFVWMKTIGGAEVPHQGYTTPYVRRANMTAFELRMSDDYMDTSPIDSSFGEFDLHVYSLCREIPNQYGPIDDMVSMPIGSYDGVLSGSSVNFKCFNGDTFITKYGLTTYDEPYFPYESVSYMGSEWHRGAYISGITYFWIESSNNYNYRHYIENDSISTSDMPGAGGSVPFYPRMRRLTSDRDSTVYGLLTLAANGFVRPGYASQYNTQYSAKSNLIPYAVTPLEDITEDANLNNRIIYSDIAVQGEKLDSYLQFLPNNYTDIPLEYGELTDIFVSGELYASTANVIWRTFYNALATQATSLGEVILGNGGAFNSPDQPMFTVDGGYAGISDWKHSEHTVFGRLFVDKMQGVIFNMGEIITPVSHVLGDSNKELIFNTANDLILLGTEMLHERSFVRIGDTVLSLDLRSKQFISTHSMKPRWFMNLGYKMYTNYGSEGSLYVHGTNSGVGSYHGALPAESYIVLVSNMANSESKLYKTIELSTRVETSAGLNLPFKTFDTIEVWNDERYTGEVDIVVKSSAFQQEGVLEALTSKVKDVYRLAVPPDMVKDPNSGLFSPANLNQLPGDTIKAKWLPKIRGTFAVIKLTVDNANGDPLYLHGVNVELGQNKR